MQALRKPKELLLVLLLATSFAACGVDQTVTAPSTAADPSPSIPPALGQPLLDWGDITIGTGFECVDDLGGGGSASAYFYEDCDTWYDWGGPLESNPYGCRGQIDHVHKSSHVPGTINSVARTRCDVAVPAIGVHIQIQIRACSFGFCYWADAGLPGTDITTGTLAQANSATTSCITGEYRAAANHQATGPNSVTYYRNTRTPPVFIVC